MGSQLDKRVILHIDVDCFYAQVEESRRPELKGRPLGIFQKFLVVTCNYPARNAGVAKMCAKEDALRVCPDLVLINGEDLTPYRAVSKRILHVMRRFGVVERRGMDEAYLDVTEEVRKRMALAVGPTPVYRGFVGKVLAGPQKKQVVAAGQTERNREPTSQTGEPLEAQNSSISQAGQSQSLTSFGGLQKVTTCEVQPEEEGVLVDRPIGTGHVAAQLVPESGHVAGRQSTERGHVAAQRGTTTSVSSSLFSDITSEDRGSNPEWEMGSLTVPEEALSNPAGSCELVERFVPPGWRPLLRPRGSDNVSNSWRNGASIDLKSAVTAPTDSDRNQSFQHPNLNPSGSLTPVLHSPDSGSLAANPVNVNPLVSNPLAQRRQYGSLAEAFGGVLKRPGNAPGESADTPEPGAKRARVDPGFENTDNHGKKLSWLDWRNEIDPGVPGESFPGHSPSFPGHGTPGKSASGKLPGHWSDVRQVRFQPAAPDGVLQTTEKLDFGTDVAGSDWLLLVGSHVAAEVREAIWAEVGCRCSAGIAHNKMLAKLASPMNKPDGQTTMLTGAVAGHIQNLPARKIPGIGWSYDAKLREMKIDTIGDLQKVALPELEEKFGVRVGGMIYQCCRGEDLSAVEDKGPPKSLSVEDSFRACLNLKQAEGIVKALAADYIDRLDEEREDTGRRPKTLTVRWRQKGASYQGHATSGPMPQDITVLNLPKPRREDALVRSAMALLSKAFAGKKFHLVKLNVGATNFVEEPPKGSPSLLRSWVGKGTGNGSGPESVGSGILNKGGQGVPTSGLSSAIGEGLLGRTEGERNGNGMVSNGNGMRAEVSVESLEGVRNSGSGGTAVRAEQSGTELSGTELGGTELGGTAAAGTNGCRMEQGGVLLVEGAHVASGEIEPNGMTGTERNGTEVTHRNGILVAPRNETADSKDRSEATENKRIDSFEPESADFGRSQITRAGRNCYDDTLRSAQTPGSWTAVSPAKGLGLVQLSPAKGLGVSGAVAGSVLHANTGSKKEARAVREAVEGLKPVLGNGHEQPTAAWQRLAKPGGSTGQVGELDLYDLDAGKLDKCYPEFPDPGCRREPGEDSDGNEDLWDDLQSVRLGRCIFRSDGPERPRDFGGVSGKGLNRESGESLGQRGDGYNRLAGNLSPSDTRRSDLTQLIPLEKREAQVVTLDDESKGVGLGATELEHSRNVGGMSILQKCSTCGEVLSENLLVRREHVDRHVAAQLQKEEDKLGALFKRLSGPVEKAPKGVLRSRNESTKAPLNRRAVKTGVGTLKALWKHD